MDEDSIYVDEERFNEFLRSHQRKPILSDDVAHRLNFFEQAKAASFPIPDEIQAKAIELRKSLYD